MNPKNPGTSPAGAAPVRNEIDPQWKWNLAALFARDEDWEREFEAIESEIDRIAAFKGTLSVSAERLFQWLRFNDEFGVRFGKLGNYAFRKYDEDTAVSKYQAYMNRVMSIHAHIQEVTAWVLPEILEIGEARIGAFLSSHQGLAIYAHALDEMMRLKQYTLSPREEELIALAQETASAPAAIFGMFNDADIRYPSIKDENGEEIELTKGRYLQFLESPDRRVRKDAYLALYSEYRKWRNTLAATLSGQVKQSIFHARARNYNSSLHAALYSDAIPLSVYDNVVDTMGANLAPLHRAIALRKRVLDLDAVMPYDLSVPLSRETARTFDYEEAKELVRAGVRSLGERYSADIAAAFTDGWIDVYETRGKRSGAYSSWTYGSHPVILLNYSGTLKDVFTLAHELGHSMHSYYTWKNQPPVYGGYSIFCAEVASTCNEILLLHHLLQVSETVEFKRHLLMHHIDTIRGTVYNQALFAEFEKLIHHEAEHGTPMTADFFDSAMDGLYRRYYGTEFEMDALFAANWSRIPHFYRSFYVFQYATGFSAAATLAQGILSRKTGALERYLAFLAAGSSKYSIDVLREAGVDMSSPAPVEAAARLMDSLIDQYEALL